MTEPSIPLSPPSPPSPPRRRRRWPLYLLAFVVLLLALVALAPSLGAGFAKGFVERGFDAQRQGRLEIGSLELAWFARQKLDGARLLDPDGREVARASVELPSLLELARSGGTKLGRIVVVASADLVAADDGTTNLERALAWRPEVWWTRGVDTPDDSEPTDIGELVRELELDVELRVERVAWSDARTRATGKPFAIEDLLAKIAAQPGQPLRVAADGKLAGEKPGRLHADIALHDLLDAQGLSPNARFELDATLDDCPSALVDALAQQDGLVAAALGSEFRVVAKGSGTLQSGQVELAIHGPNGEIEFAGELAGGVLSGTKPEALRVALRPEPALLERFVGANVPEGVNVVALGEPSLALVLTGLRVDVNAILAALNAQQDVAAAAVAASELTLSASTCSWRVSGASLLVEGGVELLQPRVALRLVPKEAARELVLDVTASLGGGASGGLAVAVHCDDLARMLALDSAQLSAAPSGDEPLFTAAVVLKQFGTAPLAAFAPEGIVPAELIGAALDVRVDVGNRGASRVAALAITSPQLEVHASGWLAGGEVVLTPGAPLTLVLRAPGEAMQRALAGVLPDGVKLEPMNELRVTVGDGLRLPLQRLQEAATTDERLAALLQHGDASVAVTLDRLGVQDATLAAADRWLRLQDLALELRLAHVSGAAGLAASLRAKLDDPSHGELRVELLGPDGAALAALIDLRDLPSLKLALDAQHVPIDLLDALGAGDGALVQRLGRELGVKLTVDVAQAKSAPLTANVDGVATLAAGETRLVAALTIDDPLQRRAPRAAGALPKLGATFELHGTGLASGFLPADLAATVMELVGDSVTGTLSNEPAPGSTGLDDTQLAARLDMARVQLTGAARIRKGVLTIGATPFELSLRPTPAMIETYVGASLPEGAQLAFASAEPQVTLRASAVELPLDAWLVPAGGQAASLADVLRRTSAKVALALPDLSYSQPALGATGKAVPVAIEQLAVEAVLAPHEPATADVRGKISGARAGGIALHASVADIGALAEPAEGAALPTMDLKGELTGVPTVLVDALAAQDGLLVDVLGPEVDLKLAGSYPSAPGEPLTVDMKSAKASLRMVAQLGTTTLVAVDQQGLDATLPLSPLFSQRIVGKLVPLLVHATKPEGAKPVALSVSKFSLPLDGDLSKLNGTVALDLGEVGYELLPGLDQLLALANLQDVASAKTTLKPLTIPIVNGVAGYDALPVKLGGKEYIFTGTYDLAKSEMRFATALPLSLLGKKVSSELEKAREYLDPQMLVPIEIHGAWNKPKLKLGDKFVDDVLKSALDGLLKKGLEDLLGGKKKPKDKQDKDK